MHVANAVQKQLGLANLKLTWVPLTAENRIDMVAQGKVDIECGTTTATLSRQERVDFSLMTFVDGGSLLSTSGTNIRELADFADKRIAVIPGTTTEKALADFLKQKSIAVQTVRVKDHSEGLAAIEGGQAEAFASDRGILIGLAITSKDPTRFFWRISFSLMSPTGSSFVATTGRFGLSLTGRWPSSIVLARLSPSMSAGSVPSVRGVRRFTSCTFSTDCPNNGCFWAVCVFGS